MTENAKAAKENTSADLTVIDFNTDISSSFFIIKTVPLCAAHKQNFNYSENRKKSISFLLTKGQAPLDC
ncbi:hypothetical protein VU03_01325, partial [Desulfobulbus sp. N3]|nr:hypothetical protein [Desulfobulbus sp. N3]